MAQKYYSLEEAAEILGVSAREVTRMREQNDLRVFSTGTDWRFKIEDVSQLAKQRQAEAAMTEGEEGDVLLSEHELGESDPTASGTVIGPSGEKISTADSDIELADSGLRLDDAQPAEAAGSDLDVDATTEFEDLDLTLDEDVTLDDSGIDTAGGEAVAEESGEKDDSGLDLSAEGEGFDDDDLVLGGSGSGSDITIGGDSGISLVDPSDSGLSLEEPLELGGGSEESLELGEDDMISLSEEADLESPTELKPEQDFTLTPLGESDEDDSESGSQVIALDTEEDAEVGPLGDDAAMPPMLDEELAPETLGMEPQQMLGAAGAAMAPAAALAEGELLRQRVSALPEAPYSVLNVLGLTACVLILTLTGMMMYDLLRNMWSWESPYPVNSSLMDAILGLFE